MRCQRDLVRAASRQVHACTSNLAQNNFSESRGLQLVAKVTPAVWTQPICLTCVAIEFCAELVLLTVAALGVWRHTCPAVVH